MNVLIVDDQLDVVLGMERGIKWDTMPIDCVYKAYSAEEAKGILQKYTVDILLSDIEMPGENGLELFRFVKESQLEIECIFLTSHMDFEYVQTALKMGSFDYILQPAPYGEIEKAIMRVAERIQSKNTEKMLKKEGQYWKKNSASFMEMCIRDAWFFYEDWEKVEKIIIKEWDGEKVKDLYYIPVLIRVLKWQKVLPKWDEKLVFDTVDNFMRELLDGKEKYLLTKLNSNYELILCFSENLINRQIWIDAIERGIDFSRTKLGMKMAAYCYDNVRIGEFSHAVSNLKEMDNENTDVEGKVFLYERNVERDYDLGERKLDIQGLHELLEAGNGKIFSLKIRDYWNKTETQGHVTAVTVKYIYSVLVSLFYSVVDNRRLEEIWQLQPRLKKRIENTSDKEEIFELVEEIADFSDSLEKNNAENEESIVEKAKSYIEKNMEKNLTRQEIADVLFLNQDYLGKLFKKSEGVSLKEYIWRVKIEKAKSLLRNTKLSVSVIAVRVGFTNFAHFSQVFKKNEGVTPVEYRKKMNI